MFCFFEERRWLRLTPPSANANWFFELNPVYVSDPYLTFGGLLLGSEFWRILGWPLQVRISIAVRIWVWAWRVSNPWPSPPTTTFTTPSTSAVWSPASRAWVWTLVWSRIRVWVLWGFVISPPPVPMSGSAAVWLVSWAWTFRIQPWYGATRDCSQRSGRCVPLALPWFWPSPAKWKKYYSKLIQKMIFLLFRTSDTHPWSNRKTGDEIVSKSTQFWSANFQISDLWIFPFYNAEIDTRR